MRVATDIGGTFTDLVWIDEQTGEVHTTKSSTTPANFEQGVLEALATSGARPEEVTTFIHGTTIVINTLTERSGSSVGLITTRGFRDVLEIGRANRPDMYNFYYRKPRPFAPRHLRLEVDERVSYEGDELTPLDEAQVCRAVAELRAAGVDAIAVCFLHSYANPTHELRCAEIARREWPDAPVTVSSGITREWREYERTSTAVLNAYVQPRARQYLRSLRARLRDADVHGSFYVMQSNGGTTSFRDAEQAPIQLVESGPVAGVYGAALLGQQLGLDNIIALDIGGTTAKCSLIDGGEVKVSTDYRIEWARDFAGYPIKVPVIDIVEIGAGGGSIGWFDGAGALHVGPRSAGADPGPACYGRGNREPTITDAALVGGRIDPTNFLGGEIQLDVAAAHDALGRIGAPLGLSAEEAAIGMIRLANANMVTALKLISVQRGYDPRDFTLVAFGGGGAMHAAELAAELRMPRVIIPTEPAVFSAWGMLMSDLRRDVIQTHIVRSDDVQPPTVTSIWRELEDELAAFFHEEGVDASAVRFARRADMRYLGQEHTVNVPFPTGDVTAGALEEVRESFHARHQRLYTYRLDAPVEFVSFHVTAAVAVAASNPAHRPPQKGDGAQPRGRRRVTFDAFGTIDTPVYDRASLGSGVSISGPAIIEEPAATTVVFPAQVAQADDYGHLHITIGAQP